MTASWRVVVICKKSAYQQLTGAPEDRARIERLIREENPSVRHMEKSHAAHTATVEAARVALSRLGAEASFHHLDEGGPVDGADLVITLGGDGTLLWASHAVGSDVPMLAVNTSPNTSVGYFCAGDRDQLDTILEAARNKKLKRTHLTRMRVTVDGDVVSDRVLNDALFCATCPAATTKYVAYHRDNEEEQRSSGVWVGPAAGSTAAQRSAGGKVLPIRSKRLQFIVREPYFGDGPRFEITKGLVEPEEEFRLINKTMEASLYLDGPHRVRQVNLGADIRMMRSPERLTILGMRTRGTDRTELVSEREDGDT